MKRPFRIIKLSLTIICLTASTLLFAHNHLEMTFPADGSVLSMAPEKIELRFEDECYLVSVELMTAGGDAVAMNFTPPPELSTHFTIPLPALAAGQYRAKWAVEGTDTHKLNGELTFTVKSSGKD